jgi:hypothetical protein
MATRAEKPSPGSAKEPQKESSRQRSRLKFGPLAPIVLTTGLGLLLCSVANALSRATLDPSQLIFWAGVLLIGVPIFYRLTAEAASTRERLALVVLLGLSLYCVKVIRDAPLFTFSDELVHAFNADQISSYHHLFRANEVLPVTPFYPGLEGATSALMTIAGLSSFSAGVIVVGAARVLLMLGLFFVFTRVSGSPRTAGLGVAIYVGNFNFLFWGAQYSYESLSLPLLVVVIMAFAEREASPRQWAREWAVPILLGTAAIVVTHHLTSYALVAFIAALAVAYWFVHRTWHWANPWRFAVAAAVLALGWTLLVASSTIDYLSPVLSEAFEAIFNTAAGAEAPRGLFQAKESVDMSTPILAKGVALLAVLLLAAALPVGLLKLWRRHRNKPLALIFALAGLAFFATLALRLAPAAWETGNRASEFLFIGLAFTLACAGFERWRPRDSQWLGRAAISGALGIILVGGAIAGWPWDLQLAPTLRASADGKTVVSPSLGAAEWAQRHLAVEDRFAANPADARMLMVPGGKTTLTGKTPDIEDILIESGLSGWELPLLEENDIRYLVVDRRKIASNALKGYSFIIPARPELSELLPKDTVTKFREFPDATRIYANGYIAVLDLEGRR